MREATRVEAVVDGHVHLHACYPPDVFLDTAHRNLSRAAARIRSSEPRAYFLLMSECEPDDYFGALRTCVDSDARGSLLQRWTVTLTAEPECIVARDGERQLFIIAGRQVQCREGLEVLVLGTTQRFRDGQPIRSVLTAASALDRPHVIPWGLGKWFFQRGRLLSELLADFAKPTLFLGDEGGRPTLWPYPAHFRAAERLGIRDLPGTDPLPFAHDIVKVGRVGFHVAIDLVPEHPMQSLFRVVCNGRTALERFATLEPPLSFVRNQVAMQLRKRRAAPGRVAHT